MERLQEFQREGDVIAVSKGCVESANGTETKGRRHPSSQSAALSFAVVFCTKAITPPRPSSCLDPSLSLCLSLSLPRLTCCKLRRDDDVLLVNRCWKLSRTRYQDQDQDGQEHRWSRMTGKAAVKVRPELDCHWRDGSLGAGEEEDSYCFCFCPAPRTGWRRGERR